MSITYPSFLTDGESTDEGTIIGLVETRTGESLESIFDPEAEEEPTEDDFAPVFSTAEKFLEKFDAAFEKELLENIAADITDESYADAPDEPTEEHYKVLEADLILKSAQFFPDGMMLIYESPRVYPKEEIVAELNGEFELEEAFVDE